MKIILYACAILLVLTVLYIAFQKKKSTSENVIVRLSDLPDMDGQVVMVKGNYVKYDPLPEFKHDDKPILAGILLEGDQRPRLFLEQPRPGNELNELNGKNVIVKGNFHVIQPVGEGAEEHAARLAGSWLYDISVLDVE